MQDYSFIVVFILIVGIFPFVFFGISWPIYKENRRVSGNTQNHDWQYTRYVFRAPMPKEQVLQALAVRSEIDDLVCKVNTAESILTFSWYHDSREFYFVMEDTPEGCLIFLKAIPNLLCGNQIPQLLNPHMVRKLNAVLLPYSQYQDAFWA